MLVLVVLQRGRRVPASVQPDNAGAVAGALERVHAVSGAEPVRDHPGRQLGEARGDRGAYHCHY